MCATRSSLPVVSAPVFRGAPKEKQMFVRILVFAESARTPTFDRGDAPTELRNDMDHLCSLETARTLRTRFTAHEVKAPISSFLARRVNFTRDSHMPCRRCAPCDSRNDRRA